MINLLVNHPDTAGRDLSSLRAVFYGGAPMPADLQRKAAEVLGCEMVQVYGMTEAAPLGTSAGSKDPSTPNRGPAGSDRPVSPSPESRSRSATPTAPRPR